MVRTGYNVLSGAEFADIPGRAVGDGEVTDSKRSEAQVAVHESRSVSGDRGRVSHQRALTCADATDATVHDGPISLTKLIRAQPVVLYRNKLFWNQAEVAPTTYWLYGGSRLGRVLSIGCCHPASDPQVLEPLQGDTCVAVNPKVRMQPLLSTGAVRKMLLGDGVTHNFSSCLDSADDPELFQVVNKEDVVCPSVLLHQVNVVSHGQYLNRVQDLSIDERDVIGFSRHQLELREWSAPVLPAESFQEEHPSCDVAVATPCVRTHKGTDGHYASDRQNSDMGKQLRSSKRTTPNDQQQDEVNKEMFRAQTMFRLLDCHIGDIAPRSTEEGAELSTVEEEDIAELLLSYERRTVPADVAVAIIRGVAGWRRFGTHEARDPVIPCPPRSMCHTGPGGIQGLGQPVCLFVVGGAGGAGVHCEAAPRPKSGAEAAAVGWTAAASAGSKLPVHRGSDDALCLDTGGGVAAAAETDVDLTGGGDGAAVSRCYVSGGEDEMVDRRMGGVTPNGGGEEEGKEVETEMTETAAADTSRRTERQTEPFRVDGFDDNIQNVVLEEVGRRGGAAAAAGGKEREKEKEQQQQVEDKEQQMGVDGDGATEADSPLRRMRPIKKLRGLPVPLPASLCYPFDVTSPTRTRHAKRDLQRRQRQEETVTEQRRCSWDGGGRSADDQCNHITAGEGSEGDMGQTRAGAVDVVESTGVMNTPPRGTRGGVPREVRRLEAAVIEGEQRTFLEFRQAICPARPAMDPTPNAAGPTTNAEVNAYLAYFSISRAVLVRCVSVCVHPESPSRVIGAYRRRDDGVRLIFRVLVPVTDTVEKRVDLLARLHRSIWPQQESVRHAGRKIVFYINQSWPHILFRQVNKLGLKIMDAKGRY
eukprot:GHVU01140758.1.p1 GENE.GHVU01140758.1~~GHVU01140758.1.p1  ORF type:complete len:870 (+),score=104.05 GHVU01140758.1:2995-5604(+)